MIKRCGVLPMSALIPVLLTGAMVVLTGPTAMARIWSAGSGSYTFDAELIGFNEDSVILMRADHHLAAVKVTKLSQADQDYLASKGAKLSAEKQNSHQQTWTTRNGVSIIGKVVDYVSKSVTFQRKGGKVFVNDREFESLPRIYQLIAPKIVAEYEGNVVRDEKSLASWLTHRKGEPQTYQVDGVVIVLEGGDEYAIPFFLLRDEDLALLKPGWERWSGLQNDYQSQANSSLELRSLAAASQQSDEVTQQIARLQLGLQAVEVGVTSLWEVTLYPGRGVSGSPLWVAAQGRDSRAATINALNNNPGYVAGPVRRVSRR